VLWRALNCSGVQKKRAKKEAIFVSVFCPKIEAILVSVFCPKIDAIFV
jgi:hypothetical protein